MSPCRACAPANYGQDVAGGVQCTDLPAASHFAVAMWRLRLARAAGGLAGAGALFSPFLLAHAEPAADGDCAFAAPRPHGAPTTCDAPARAFFPAARDVILPRHTLRPSAPHPPPATLRESVTHELVETLKSRLATASAEIEALRARTAALAEASADATLVQAALQRQEEEDSLKLLRLLQAQEKVWEAVTADKLGEQADRLAAQHAEAARALTAELEQVRSACLCLLVCQRARVLRRPLQSVHACRLSPRLIYRPTRPAPSCRLCAARCAAARSRARAAGRRAECRLHGQARGAQAERAGGARGGAPRRVL